MFKLNFRIAIRSLQKNLGNTFINIGGMAVAIAAFLVIVLYVKYEKEYDASNPNYENIYLVGRNLQDNISNLMSPQFANKIKEVAPEVDLVGKIKYTTFEFALSSKSARIYEKNVLTADFDAYKILNFKVNDEVFKYAKQPERNFFLSENNYRTLFPNKKDQSPELVGIGNVAEGMTSKVQGRFKEEPHSNFIFDGLAIGNDISEGQDLTDYSYTTFIQVKPNTDIENLTRKLNTLYLSNFIKRDESIKPRNQDRNIIYLDPLKNLHLKARSSVNNSERIVEVILYLGILVLLLACVNFINMSIAQSSIRAKEIGVKKVMGASKNGLIMQFLFEIFIQCVIAAILGLIAAEFIVPVVNNLFEIHLSIWTGDQSVLFIIGLMLVAVTLLAGLYPSFVLSSYKPAVLLKGNFSNSAENQGLKKALLVFQFSIAIAFIVGLLVIRGQLNYMQTQDKGFSTNQVLCIRNMMIFDNQDVFKPVKDQLLKIDGVKSVSVANHIPTGPKASSQIYSVNGNDQYLNPVAVDIDFFQTLDVKLASGRFFSEKFKTDTATAVILNETAVKKYNLINPIGKLIRGCNTSFQIVGVIKDFKADGFENAVEPTVYSLKNKCGDYKTLVLIKVNQGKIPQVLRTLKSSWSSINKRDGDDFRYDFMDNLYGKLFKKQEQLRFVFTCLSTITILVALCGLYAYAKYITNTRLKEIAIRKILGANNLQIFTILNNYFVWLIILSNLIAAPIVYIYGNYWLEGFAYKQSISILPFVLTSLLTVLLTVVTVFIQALKAIKTRPVVALRYE
jgi:putative ABC transport system permease protein